MGLAVDGGRQCASSSTIAKPVNFKADFDISNYVAEGDESYSLTALPPNTDAELLDAMKLLKAEVKQQSHPLHIPEPFWYFDGESIDRTQACLELVVIGLRDLPPFNFQEIKSPYIELRMDSVGEVKKTDISRTPSPKNPNFVRTFHFNCMLPVEEIYRSPLQVRLSDCVFICLSC